MSELVLTKTQPSFELESEIQVDTQGKIKAYTTFKKVRSAYENEMYSYVNEYFYDVDENVKSYIIYSNTTKDILKLMYEYDNDHNLKKVISYESNGEVKDSFSFQEAGYNYIITKLNSLFIYSGGSAFSQLSSELHRYQMVGASSKALNEARIISNEKGQISQVVVYNNKAYDATITNYMYNEEGNEIEREILNIKSKRILKLL